MGLQRKLKVVTAVGTAGSCEQWGRARTGNLTWTLTLTMTLYATMTVKITVTVSASLTSVKTLSLLLSLAPNRAHLLLRPFYCPLPLGHFNCYDVALCTLTRLDSLMPSSYASPALCAPLPGTK